MTISRLLILGVMALTMLGQSAWAMSSAGTSGPMIPEFKSGMMAVKANDFVEAEKNLKEAIKNNPNHPDSFSLLGFTSRKLGKPDAAFQYYEEALKIDPKFRPALNYLGHLYLETGQIDKAKETLEKLSDACFFGCPEYSDLKDAVAAGKSGKY